MCVSENYPTILHCEFELVVKCVCVVYNLRGVGCSRHHVNVLKFQVSNFVFSSNEVCHCVTIKLCKPMICMYDLKIVLSKFDLFSLLVHALSF